MPLEGFRATPQSEALASLILSKKLMRLEVLWDTVLTSSGIQFKMLNKTKGRAVWANRVQVDKKKYPKIISRILKQHKSISIIEGEVVEVKTKGARVASVV